MHTSPPATDRARPEPMPENFTSVQPGGGLGMTVELLWGRLRRGYLRWARPGYVRRMAALRRGSDAGAPHAILDPRDLKYCRNQVACSWAPADDPFQWRERLPLARWGLAELQLAGWPLLVLTILLAGWWPPAGYLAAVPLALIVWFFRDPPRRIPQTPGWYVSPADGRISEVTELEDDELIGGPAVRIGVFLSIFNVHINRMPAAGRVIALRYAPGEFRNALDPASPRVNESTSITVEEDAPPYRTFAVRQIAGTAARRIVCDLRTGESVDRGGKLGMIKLGSRTELILPRDETLEVLVASGDRVAAGSSVLARQKQC